MMINNHKKYNLSLINMIDRDQHREIKIEC